jgi:cellulose synthase/poly-beta-1,6-N-acetylglucosamine synthase-like glycosyltransferase/transposase-like protein
MTTAHSKKEAVERIISKGETVSAIAREFKVARKTIYSWIKTYKKAANKRTALSPKYKKGKFHSRSVRHKYVSKLIRILKKNPSYGIKRLSKVLKCSENIVYAILKDLELTTEVSRHNFAGLYTFPGVFEKNIKLSIVRAAKEKEKTVSALSAEFNIARKTIYRWLKEFEAKGEVGENYVRGFEHHKSFSESRVADIIEAVRLNPALSIHSLAKVVGVSSHGVYNVLKRSGLTTRQARMSFAATAEPVKKPSFTRVSEGVRDFLGDTTPNVLPAPPPAQKLGFLRYFKVFATSLFFTFLLAIAAIYWYDLLFVKSESAVQSIGYIFATIALLSGSFFFLYSLKYYLTLAIVLSYSQKEGEKGTKKMPGILEWLLGTSKKTIGENNSSASGLQADMSHVILKRSPFVSVQIPFYNEKNVVERSIRAATSMNYPEFEVILCDDSTDETTDIIRKYQKDCLYKNEKLKEIKGEGWTMTEVEIRPGVTLKHLHRTSRDGYKGKALDIALTLANPKTEFVSIFDADFVPYPDTLELFLKYFQASSATGNVDNLGNIGAVQGYQWHVLNKSENWITRGVRSEYSGSYVIERSGAEIYGGLKQISGSVYMIRSDVLRSIGWGTSITEDFELTLRLYEKGFKVLYTPYIQAPAECVSTLKRLIRQRMRWAEGHSQNIKKMFKSLMLSPYLTRAEKLEFLYLSPYYLQAFFFLIGTFSWLLAETVFKVRLPFWTELWGWSLVLTNMISLPLVNTVGLFLEESDEKDYSGIGSFITLSYLLVPFQAYAAVKGLLEDKEGPWFRTPKTGRITDMMARGKFMRFIQGMLPGGKSILEEKYLKLTSANSTFDTFDIKPQGNKVVGKIILASMILLTMGLASSGSAIENGSLADLPIQTRVVDELEPGLVAQAKDILLPKEVLAETGEITTALAGEINNASAGEITAVVSVILSLSISILVYLFKKHRKVFRRVVKVGGVAFLLTSWLLTGQPILWQTEKFRFPPKIEETKAADINVDGISESMARGMRSVVFISPSVGYIFHRDSGSDFTYVKTTDGGATWSSGAPVDIYAGTATAYDVWYDRWTPGGTGTIIHTWWMESGTDDVHYRSLDTNGDSLGTDTVVFAGGSATSSRGVFVSGAKARGGNLLVAFDMDAGAERGTYRSTDNGASWGVRTNMVEATLDQGFMFPGNETDTQDMWFLYHDASVDELTLKVHDDSANTNSESSAIMTLVENTADAAAGVPGGQYGFAGTIRQSDNHLLVVGASEYDTTTADIRTFDINGTGSITEKGAISTNIDDHYYPNIYIDETDRVRVSYIGKRDGSETLGTTVGVYYTTSTDGMANWTSGDTAYSESTGNFAQTWVPQSGSRFLVVWRNLTSVDMFTNYNNSILTGANQASYRWRNDDGSETAATWMDNESAAVSNISTSTIVRLRLEVENTASVTLNGRLQYSSNATSCTDGTWTALDTSTTAWRVTASSNITNDEATTNQLTSSALSFTAGNAFDTQNEDTTGVALNNTHTELEWAIRGDGAAAATTYRFRVTDAGSELGSYSNCAQLTTSATGGYHQPHYRIRSGDTVGLNTDSGWAAALDTPATIDAGGRFRIRFELEQPDGTGGSQDYILQYRYRTSSGSWGAWGSTPNIEGSGEDGPVHVLTSSQYNDSDAASTNLLAGSAETFDATGTGEENRQTPFVTVSNEHAEFEWTLMLRGTWGGPSILSDNDQLEFRMALSAGTALTGVYNNPRVTANRPNYYIGAVTPETPGRMGPFKDSNGNLYVIVEPTHISGTGNNEPEFMKSTDGGLNWTFVGTSGSPTVNDLESLDIHQVGDTLHMCVQSGLGASNYPVTYHTFRLSDHGTNPDTWGIIDEAVVTPTTAATDQSCGISRRSDGSVVIFYRGSDGTNQSVYYKIRSTGGTWGSEIELDNTASTDFNFSGDVLGASDKTHIFYRDDTANSIYHKSLTSGDVLSARELIELDAGTTADHWYTVPQVYWTDPDGNEKIMTVYRDGSDDLMYSKVITNDGTPEARKQVSSTTVQDSPTGTQSSQLAADLVVDEYTDVVIAAFSPENDRDLDIDYTSNDAGWHADTTIRTGTMDYIKGEIFTHSSGNGGETVYGYYYEDAGGGAPGFGWYGEVGLAHMNLVSYRFYGNTDSTDVGAALAGQNTAAPLTSDGQAFRLRFLMHLSGDGSLAAGTFNYKIQIAQKSGTCDTSFVGETYTDLSTSSGDIRYFNNPTPADGAALTGNANDPTHSGHTVVNQTYEESNNFTNTSSIATGADGKWDITLEDTSAAADTSYCVRVVFDNGTLINMYTVIPEFTTVPENPFLLFGLYPLAIAMLKKLRRKNKKS